jgi:uncharacterized protein
VKVLEVDVLRKRIALTRRLDDVPGEARGGGYGGSTGPAPGNSAMADALKALKR